MTADMSTGPDSEGSSSTMGTPSLDDAPDSADQDANSVVSGGGVAQEDGEGPHDLDKESSS